jgi:hypothetical protein
MSPNAVALVGQGAQNVHGADQHIGARCDSAEPPGEDIQDFTAAKNLREGRIDGKSKVRIAARQYHRVGFDGKIFRQHGQRRSAPHSTQQEPVAGEGSDTPVKQSRHALLSVADLDNRRAQLPPLQLPGKGPLVRRTGNDRDLLPAEFIKPANARRRRDRHGGILDKCETGEIHLLH